MRTFKYDCFSLNCIHGSQLSNSFIFKGETKYRLQANVKLVVIARNEYHIQVNMQIRPVEMSPATVCIDFASFGPSTLVDCMRTKGGGG